MKDLCDPSLKYYLKAVDKGRKNMINFNEKHLRRTINEMFCYYYAYDSWFILFYFYRGLVPNEPNTAVVTLVHMNAYIVLILWKLQV